MPTADLCIWVKISDTSTKRLIYFFRRKYNYLLINVFLLKMMSSCHSQTLPSTLFWFSSGWSDSSEECNIIYWSFKQPPNFKAIKSLACNSSPEKGCESSCNHLIRLELHKGSSLEQRRGDAAIIPSEDKDNEGSNYIEWQTIQSGVPSSNQISAFSPSTFPLSPTPVLAVLIYLEFVYHCVL